MQLYLNLFRCYVLISYLFETRYPIFSADVNIILEQNTEQAAKLFLQQGTAFSSAVM